jgi:HPt (histidine-containing phosphotransfer) domain-containing protein
MENSNYDLQVVADTIGIDIETMEMLTEEFLNVMDEEMASLGKAIEANDGEMITHLAHKMKGACASMMIEPLRTNMETLQKIDKSEKEQIKGLYESSVPEYATFRAKFRD